MKKKTVTLIATLLLSLTVSACGGNDSQDSSSRSEAASGSEASAGEIHTLTDWYNSGDRVQLEADYADLAEGLGMTYFVSVREPDTLVFNYQFTEQIDFGDASREEIDAVFAQSMQSYTDTARPIFSGFQEEYGIPLSVVRLIYLNADGTLISSMDFTEENTAAPDEASVGDSGSLPDWLHSDVTDAIVAETNKNLTYSGMTFRLSADGNILVYEYLASETLGLRDLSAEELNERLDGVVESQRETILSLFDLFQDEYGITLDAVRIVFLNEDGSEILYTSELP